MQVATTVFVGNITDKATDTLVRQVLLVGIILWVTQEAVYVVLSHVVRSDVATLLVGSEFRMLQENCKVSQLNL